MGERLRPDGFVTGNAIQLRTGEHFDTPHSSPKV